MKLPPEYIFPTGSPVNNIMHHLPPVQTGRLQRLHQPSGGWSVARWTRTFAGVSLLVFQAISSHAQSHGLLPIGSVVVSGSGPSAYVSVISNYYLFHGDLLRVETATDSDNEKLETR